MIRNYKSIDLDSLMKIWLEGNLDAHDFIDESYWKDNFEQVKRELPNAQLYVDEEDGEIAGFVGMQGNYIAGIFVKRDYRGHGIGGNREEYENEKEFNYFNRNWCALH